MTNAANASVHLASYIVSAAWQIPLLTAAGWLAARVLRRLHTALEHNVWEMTLLLCVLMPALPAPRSSGHAITIAIAEAGIRTSVSEQTGSNLAWRGPVWVPMTAVQIVCGLWALIVLFAALRLGLAMYRTRRLVASATRCALPDDLEAVWQDCLRGAGIREARVLTSAAVAGPMTVSLRGHVLLLPERFTEEVSAIDFRAAAAHECAHMQRNDFRQNLAHYLIALPVAFHPVLRLLRRQLIASREIACDRAAAEAMGDAPSYRSALLRLAAWIANQQSTTQTLAMAAAVGIFDSNSLEERMERLAQPATTTGKPTRFVLATIAIACLAGTACAAAVGAVRLAPLTQTVTKAAPPAVIASAAPPVKFASSQATAPQPSAKPKKAAVYTIVAPPRLIHQVDPNFPADARLKGETGGECIIGLVVGADGVPRDVHITKSLGKDFDENAMVAVRQYRFKPSIRQGKPVAVALNIAVNYQIF